MGCWGEGTGCKGFLAWAFGVKKGIRGLRPQQSRGLELIKAEEAGVRQEGRSRHVSPRVKAGVRRVKLRVSSSRKEFDGYGPLDIRGLMQIKAERCAPRRSVHIFPRIKGRVMMRSYG